MSSVEEIAALRAENERLKQELWHIGLCVGQIAKWPRGYFNRFYVEEWALRTHKVLRDFDVAWRRADDVLKVEGHKAIKNSRLLDYTLSNPAAGGDKDSND